MQRLMKSISIAVTLAAMTFLNGAVVVRRNLPPDARVMGILNQEATALSAVGRSTLATAVTTLAAQYAIDPLLIVAIIHVESNFQPQARSGVGAIGLMQVREIVVRDVAAALALNPARAPFLLRDVTHNVRIGIHYFSTLLQRFDRNLVKSLLAYNQGPTLIARRYGRGLVAPTGYAAKVLQVYQRYRRS